LVRRWKDEEKERRGKKENEGEGEEGSESQGNDQYLSNHAQQPHKPEIFYRDEEEEPLFNHQMGSDSEEDIDLTQPEIIAHILYQ
jgi:hypothetical protein